VEELGVWVESCESSTPSRETDCFTVSPVGEMILRSRQSGDKLRLPGSTKSLKKLLFDRKIPEYIRNNMIVIADDLGVLAVQGIGPNLDRLGDSGVQIRFVYTEKGGPQNDQ
jgi:tRNA(Ile)-lysidine synthetase-like protein